MELIYRGTRDGMISNVFHNKCDNKVESIILIKMRKEIYLEDMLLFLGLVLIIKIGIVPLNHLYLH